MLVAVALKIRFTTGELLKDGTISVKPLLLTFSDAKRTQNQTCHSTTHQILILCSVLSLGRYHKSLLALFRSINQHFNSQYPINQRTTSQSQSQHHLLSNVSLQPPDKHPVSNKQYEIQNPSLKRWSCTLHSLHKLYELRTTTIEKTWMLPMLPGRIVFIAPAE